MLTDQLQQLVREAGGDALLLDARQHKGLISDAAQLIDILKNLRNAGFTRMIDYTAAHLGTVEIKPEQERGRDTLATPEAAASVPPDGAGSTAAGSTAAGSTAAGSTAAGTPPLPGRLSKQLLNKFQLSLVLRAPRHEHAHLVLKWTWPAVGAGPRPAGGVAGHFSAPTAGSRTEVRPTQDVATHDEADTRSAPTGQPSAPTTKPEAQEKPEAVTVDPELARLGVTAHEIKPEEPIAEPPAGNGDGLPVRPKPAEPGYNSAGGAGQPGGQPLQAGPVAPHPSLSHIWPAAGLAEREIWEMLGIPFSGHDNLAPLLLDEQFSTFPLRRGFTAPERASYAANLLNERHEQAMLDAVVGAHGGVGATHASPATDHQSIAVGQAARLPSEQIADEPSAPRATHASPLQEDEPGGEA